MTDEARAFWGAFFPSAFADGPRFVPGLNQLLRPEGFAAEDLRKWIKHHSEANQITPTEWAREANLAPSTLNRFLKGNGPSNIRADTIEALAEVLIARMSARVQKVTFSKRHAFPVEVISKLHREPYVTFEWESTEDYEIRIPIPADHFGPPAFGIEIGDYEVDGYEDGDILIVTPAQTLFWDLNDGQRFIVHERVDLDFVMTSIRRLVIDPIGEKWLVRVSDEDTTRSMHLGDINEKGFSSSHFVSMGVIGSIRAERWLGYRRC